MKSSLITALIALTVTTCLTADTIRMKDGTQYEGTIVSEDAESYTIRIEVSAGIRDEKRLPKPEVAAVKRSGPDDVAFEEIAKLVPAPDRMAAEEYQERIAKVNAFLDAYPQSTHLKEARKILETLEKERELAADGALKLTGRWITGNERAANAYEIDARLLANDFKADARAGRFRDALRHFEVLRQEFRNSSHFQPAAELAKQVLVTYQRAVADDLEAVDDRKKQREEEIQRIASDERETERAAIARRDAAYERLVKSEKQDLKTNWPTLDPYHPKPMEETLRAITKTLAEIERDLQEDVTPACPVYRAAWMAAAAGNKEEASDLIRELQSLDVPERYIVMLEKKLEDAGKTDPTGEPPAGPDGEPRPGSATADDDPENEPEGTRTATGEDQPGKTETASPRSPASPSADRQPDKAEKGFPMRSILLVVMIVVIIVALVAAFGGKKK